jgi:hypothetical protein
MYYSESHGGEGGLLCRLAQAHAMRTPATKAAITESMKPAKVSPVLNQIPASDVERECGSAKDQSGVEEGSDNPFGDRCRRHGPRRIRI